MHWTIISKSFSSFISTWKIPNRLEENLFYCRSIIHVASCMPSRSIPNSFCCRYYASVELSSRDLLPPSHFFSVSPLARSKKKTSAKLRKCKLVRRHLPLQRPFPSETKLCEEVVITESSRRHSEGHASPKHLQLVFIVRYDISEQTSLDM